MSNSADFWVLPACYAWHPKKSSSQMGRGGSPGARLTSRLTTRDEEGNAVGKGQRAESGQTGVPTYFHYSSHCVGGAAVQPEPGLGKRRGKKTEVQRG